MMKSLHSPHHWIPVALVLVAALFTLSEAHGQHTGSQAVFEGRPAMSGAQGGLGAMAGPPQGGIGVQGTDDASVTLSRQAGTVSTPRSELKAENAGIARRTISNDALSAKGDIDLAPRKDSGIAKDERSAVKKSKRAAKRVMKKQRVAEIQAQKAGQ